MTSYCNNDHIMKSGSVEMKDSTEQNHFLRAKLQYHWLNRSFRYIDLPDSLNAEKNPSYYYSKNGFATVWRADFGARTSVRCNLRRQLAVIRCSQL